MIKFISNFFKAVLYWLEDYAHIFIVVIYLLFLGGVYYIISKVIDSVSPTFDTIINNYYGYLKNLILVLIYDNFRLLAVIVFIVLINLLRRFRKEKKIKARFPIIGIPNNDSFTVLLALFRIRCVEISRLYIYIRAQQKDAKDNSWVYFFLKQYVDRATDIWSYDGKARKKLEDKNEKEICALLENRFSINWYSNSDLDRINEIKLAVILYLNIYNSKKLQAIRTFGIFENTILALIHEYNIFNSRSTTVFIKDTFYHTLSREKAVLANKNIDNIWNEIISAFKATIIFFQVKNDNTLKVDFNNLLEEISALNKMESYLTLIMANKNFKESSYKPKDTNENTIINQIKDHPVQWL